MGLGHAQFPWHAGVVDGAAGGGSGTAVIATDEHHLSARLGHTSGDGADAGLSAQFDRDPGLAVGVFQVVDELGQVLDGVDVVVGRGRDEGDTGGGVAGLGHLGGDLLAGQVAALAGLGALGHFNLNVLAETRYSLVTPKRPEATCLMAELVMVPKRAGSSPPSPELDMPPRVFMAMAMHSWASREMEPKDMAPVLKRFTMESTLSILVPGEWGRPGTASP